MYRVSDPLTNYKSKKKKGKGKGSYNFIEQKTILKFDLLISLTHF